MPIDTTQPDNGVIQFELPKNSHPGIYRIIFGQTTYARVMNEPPQQLDFIYNNENIQFRTNFNSPEDSLKIMQSKENQVWFEFLQKEKEFQQQIQMLGKEVDYYWSKKDTANAIEKANKFNQLQMESEAYITQTVKSHPGFYAAKLINIYHQPLLDGYVDASERASDFKSNYFKNLDFTDASLINSSVYTDKVFDYLVKYNQPQFTPQQRENEYKKAVDIVLANTNQNEKVYEFILDYLVGGFEILKMDNLITYIADKYEGTTTMKLKLRQQKMKPGTVVPDFTLNDINGEPVTLSNVLKDKNLVLFWASWCPHCNEMVPQILRWQKSSGLTDFEVIAVSIDENAVYWKNKVFETGLENWYNLSSLKKWDCPVALEYNVYATPTLFVVDRNLKIIGKPLTLEELKSTITE